MPPKESVGESDFNLFVYADYYGPVFAQKIATGVTAHLTNKSCELRLAQVAEFITTDNTTGHFSLCFFSFLLRESYFVSRREGGEEVSHFLSSPNNTIHQCV